MPEEINLDTLNETDTITEPKPEPEVPGKDPFQNWLAMPLIDIDEAIAIADELRKEAQSLLSPGNDLDAIRTLLEASRILMRAQQLADDVYVEATRYESRLKLKQSLYVPQGKNEVERTADQASQFYMFIQISNSLQITKDYTKRTVDLCEIAFKFCYRTFDYTTGDPNNGTPAANY